MVESDGRIKTLLTRIRNYPVDGLLSMSKRAQARRDSPIRKSISRYGRHKFEISRTVSFFLLHETLYNGAYNKVHVVRSRVSRNRTSRVLFLSIVRFRLVMLEYRLPFRVHLQSVSFLFFFKLQ